MRLRPPQLLPTVLAIATTLLVSTEARATPNFPAALAADIQLTRPPDCSLCHTDGDQGGDGTVNTPFGKNMRARGLVAYDTGALSAALALMSEEKVDSAGACLPDIEELQAGGDPNTPATGGCDGGAAPVETQTAVLLPSYGCSASPLPAPGRRDPRRSCSPRRLRWSSRRADAGAPDDELAGRRSDHRPAGADGAPPTRAGGLRLRAARRR